MIGYKGSSLICILISELENEISIFLPWTDRHKSHCLQSLNTPHQIYRYWCRRERDHFLCHRNLKCKERKKKSQLWSSKRNNTGWLHSSAHSTITLLMKLTESRFPFVLPCPQLFTFPPFSLGVSLSSYSPLPHTLFVPFHRLGFLKSHPVIMLFHGSGWKCHQLTAIRSQICWTKVQIGISPAHDTTKPPIIKTNRLCVFCDGLPDPNEDWWPLS